MYDSALTEKEVRDLYNDVQQGDLSRYDFMYTGQSKNRRIFKVENGEIVWRYDNAKGRGEISDAVLIVSLYISALETFHSDHYYYDNDLGSVWDNPGHWK